MKGVAQDVGFYGCGCFIAKTRFIYKFVARSSAFKRGSIKPEFEAGLGAFMSAFFSFLECGFPEFRRRKRRR